MSSGKCRFFLRDAQDRMLAPQNDDSAVFSRRLFSRRKNAFSSRWYLNAFRPSMEYHGDFLLELRVCVAVFEDVDFAKIERLQRPQFAQLGFDRIAEAASGFGEENDFHHKQDSMSKRQAVRQGGVMLPINHQ